jgi:CheY-like chemotaxis protein
LDTPFVIRGVDPTGRVVERCVPAGNVQRARMFARSLGWAMVSVHDMPGTPSSERPILVVDDEPAVGEALVRVLKREGYDAVTVGGHAQAEAFLEAATPLLVITDFLMPGGANGFTLFIKMRADPRLRAIPFIMFSAHDEVRDAAFQAGIDAFVSKGSLDWAPLRSELRRLAGPPPRSATTPRVRRARPRDVG